MKKVAEKLNWIFNVLNLATLHDIDGATMPYPIEIVRIFYEKCNSENLGNVDKLCELYSGREKELYFKMKEKYGLHPLDLASSSVFELNLNRKVQAIVSDIIAVVEDEYKC